MIEWDRVAHFGPSEFGAWEQLDARLVYALDEFRETLGVPLHVHTAYRETSQFDDSQHPHGRAVDVCASGRLGLLEFWLEAERRPEWTGIGLYPSWAHPGLHLDIRFTRQRARWWRDLSGRYLPVTGRSLIEIAGLMRQAPHEPPEEDTA